MNDLLIRKRKFRDFLPLIKITQEAFPFWIKHIFYLFISQVFIAEKDSKTIGFIAVSLRYPHSKITLTAVDRNYRGQNIGSKIMTEVISWLKSKGIKTCYSMVRIDNPKALHFYQNHGFSIIRLFKRLLFGNVYIIKKDI